MAEFIIEHGADIEVPKNDGYMPFQLTCLDKRSKVTDFLFTAASEAGIHLTEHYCEQTLF